MIAVAPALAAVRPPHCDYGKVRDGRESGATPAREELPAVDVKPVGGRGAIPIGPDPAQIQEIIKLLETAQASLKKKVQEVIAQNTARMNEEEKEALKKKGDEITKRISALRQKIGQLLQLSPQTANKALQEINIMLAEIRDLPAVIGSVSNEDLTAAENKVAVFERRAQTIERRLFEKWFSPALAAFNNDPYYVNGLWPALEDGVIRPDELAWSGQQYFKRTGLLGISSDGLTNDEAREVARARKDWAFFLTARIKEEGVEAKDVEIAVDALMRLAAEGKLTIETADKILRPLGIVLNDDSFAVIFTGRKDRWFHTEKVANLLEFCQRAHDLVTTFEIATRIEVDWERFDDPEFPTKDRDDIHARAYEFLVKQASKDDFFIINLNKHRSMTIEAIRRKYRIPLDSANLNTAVWQRLKIGIDAQSNLGKLISEIDEIQDLTGRERFDRLVKELIRKLFSTKHLVIPGELDEERRAAEEMKVFERLMTGVQNAGPGSAVREAYIQEFMNVILPDNGRQKFEYERVLQGQKPVETTGITIPKR